MAYQQQFPGTPDIFRTPLEDAMGGYNIIVEARKRELEQEQARAAMLNAKRQADAQEQYGRNEQERLNLERRKMGFDALSRLDAMDPQMREMALRQMGATVTRRPGSVGAPPAAPASPAGNAYSGGSALPDNLEGMQTARADLEYSDPDRAAMEFSSADPGLEQVTQVSPQGRYMDVVNYERNAGMGLAPQGLGQPAVMPQMPPQAPAQAPPPPPPPPQMQTTPQQQVQGPQGDELWDIDFGDGVSYQGYNPLQAKRMQEQEREARALAIGKAYKDPGLANEAMQYVRSDMKSDDAAQLIANREARQAMLEQQAEDRRLNRELSRENSIRSTRAAAARRQELNPYQAYQIGEKERGLVIYDLGGGEAGKAKTLPEAEKIRAGQAATLALGDTLGHLKDFFAKNGTRFVPVLHGAQIKQRDQIITEATGFITKMYESGVLNGGEFERYKEMMSPDLIQSAEDANRVIDQIIKGAQNAYTRKVGSQLGGQGEGQGGQPNKVVEAKRAETKRDAVRANAVRDGGKPGKRIRLKDGRTGTLFPDGLFEPDGG